MKLFGCLIVEHNIPIDISQFSKAILSGAAHPEVHIAIGTGFLNTKRKHISLTPVMAGKLNQRIVYAGWFYIINQIAINIIYSEPAKNPKVLRHSWHPSTVGKRVRIVDFSE